MTNQSSYYDEFAVRFRNQIVNSPDPWLWTTDMPSNGPTFRAMKRRIAIQEKIIYTHFKRSAPVLDLGCGFGRHVFLLAHRGWQCVGVDYSSELISVAQSVCERLKMSAELICDSIESFTPPRKFYQITVLDVFEHLQPKRRAAFLRHLHENVCAHGAKVMFSFSNITFGRSTIMNLARSATYQLPGFVGKREHPYPIPSGRQFLHQTAPWFSLLDVNANEDTAFYVLLAH